MVARAGGLHRAGLDGRHRPVFTDWRRRKRRVHACSRSHRAGGIARDVDATHDHLDHSTRRPSALSGEAEIRFVAPHLTALRSASWGSPPSCGSSGRDAHLARGSAVFALPTADVLDTMGYRCVLQWPERHTSDQRFNPSCWPPHRASRRHARSHQRQMQPRTRRRSLRRRCALASYCRITMISWR